MWENRIMCNNEFFFYYAQKALDCWESWNRLKMRFVMRSNKKKKGRPAHTPATFHTHIPTHPSGICYEANFHICEKKKKDRSSSRKPENKAATTARHNDTLSCSGADIGTAHGICSRALSVSHVALFIWSRKVEISRVCQMWDRMRDFFLFFFHFGERNETLHPASCCDSQQDIVKCAQFFCPDLCTTWKSTACLLHGQFQ